jgi:hypothetical protein
VGGCVRVRCACACACPRRPGWMRAGVLSLWLELVCARLSPKGSPSGGSARSHRCARVPQTIAPDAPDSRFGSLTYALAWSWEAPTEGAWRLLLLRICGSKKDFVRDDLHGVVRQRVSAPHSAFTPNGLFLIYPRGRGKRPPKARGDLVCTPCFLACPGVTPYVLACQAETYGGV